MNLAVKTEMEMDIPIQVMLFLIMGYLGVTQMMTVIPTKEQPMMWMTAPQHLENL